MVNGGLQRGLWPLLLLLLWSAHAVAAQDYYAHARAFFPQADALGEMQGEPPAAGVFHGRDLIGYLLLTDQVAPIPAYSGKPVSTLVGIDLTGKITGVRIVQHQEPILLVGVTDQDLHDYIDQYIGQRVTDRVKIGGGQRDGYVTVDGISGATITVMVLNRSIMLAARKVAASRGLIPGEGPADGATPSIDDDPVLDPIWSYVWLEQRGRIAIILAALLVLTLILVFQDPLARHPTLLCSLRRGYLLFTLLFIGWYALAQLSVVNVLTFVNALTRGFSWNTFLIDPLMFILWGFVAVTIVLWGRGVYCGWLCPFGALQELLFQLGQKLGIKPWEPPQMVHERLLAIKYVLLIVLFGISLGGLGQAAHLIEVEPFKTAITLRFQREWSYVAYALGLLLIGLFTRKFFCRYLCPLGAALTFPGRFRAFEWLRRRAQCGRPCQICAEECEVRAIGPTGEINGNECHYCLDCQVTYWNDRKCPPLVDKRRKRERAAAMRSARVVMPETGPSRDAPRAMDHHEWPPN